MKERIFRFGENLSMVGILTEPTQDKLLPNSPIAIMLNAGIVHRVGPFRLHVELARSLAEAGIRSLRIDLSGLGDNPTRSSKSTLEEVALEDGLWAMDALEKQTGVGRFTVIGLCSGAYHAQRFACMDSRVVSAVFLDGIAFPTPQHCKRLAKKLWNVRFWRNAVKRRWLKLMPIDSAQSAGAKLAETQFFGSNLTREESARQLKQLVSKGVRMLFVYTGGNPDFSSSLQFEEMFGVAANDSLQVEYYSNAEHTFPLVKSRQRLVGRMVEFSLEPQLGNKPSTKHINFARIQSDCDSSPVSAAPP